MVMLSDFLRFRLTDRQQRHARVWDVAVDLAAVLAHDRRLTGALRNGPVSETLGWGTFVLVTAAATVLLGGQLLGLFGINILGS